MLLAINRAYTAEDLGGGALLIEADDDSHVTFLSRDENRSDVDFLHDKPSILVGYLQPPEGAAGIFRDTSC